MRLPHLLFLLLFPAAIAADDTSAQPSEHQGEGSQAAAASRPLGILTSLYRASGAVNRLNAGTAVHCTNLGGIAASLSVEFVDFDGTEVCFLSFSVPANGTATFTTRAVALYFSDDTCDPVPSLEQGSLTVFAAPEGSTNVVCTAQVVDAVNAVPTFITTLEMVRR